MFQFYHFPVHILPSHTQRKAKRLEDTLSDVNNITETNTADQPTLKQNNIFFIQAVIFKESKDNETILPCTTPLCLVWRNAGRIPTLKKSTTLLTTTNNYTTA